MINGFVNISKPEDMTSSDVVCIVRGIFSRTTGEKCKAGHTGTLDPLASGVLPVALGKSTRLFDYLLSKKKRYSAVFRFGETTDTLDRGGKLTESGGRVPDLREIREVLPSFVGEIDQLPPIYSAKSVDGKRAYDLARQGKPVSLAEKTVVVDSIDVAATDNPREFAFAIQCGAGTYIRALARDIAAKLGTVAYMTSLVRTASGIFTLENAVTLDALKESPLQFVLPVDFPLNDSPAVSLSAECSALAKNGVPVDLRAAGCETSFADSGCLKNGIVVRDEKGGFIGMGAVENNTLKMRAVLC